MSELPCRHGGVWHQTCTFPVQPASTRRCIDDSELEGWRRLAGQWTTGDTGQPPCFMVVTATADAQRLVIRPCTWPNSAVLGEARDIAADGPGGC